MIRSTDRRTPWRAALLALLLAPATATLGGCSFFSAHAQTRGDRIDPDALAQLVPGVSTRTDAVALFGSPTMHASFDDNVWLYIGSLTRPVIGGTQHVISAENVALTFDQAGILRTIQVTTKKNALGGTMIARVTPSPGSNATFLQQLLGNVGKFNATGSAGPNNNVGTAAAGSNASSDSSRFSTGQ